MSVNHIFISRSQENSAFGRVVQRRRGIRWCSQHIVNERKHLYPLFLPSLVTGALTKAIPFQTDCNEDMAGIMDKLRSLKHNISGVTEPTQQIFNKFVIEESLKLVKRILFPI